MYVFGIDIPLAEIFFIFLVLIIAVAIALLYVMYKVGQINRKMDKITRQEREQLADFTEVTKDEKKELSALRSMKKELDKVLDEQGDELAILKKIKQLENKKDKTGLPLILKKLTQLQKKAKKEAPFGMNVGTIKEKHKANDFSASLMKAIFKHKEEPVWRTEKWSRRGLLLVQRNRHGEVTKTKKHPLAGKGPKALPWTKEHWQPEGDVKVLRSQHGILIDWKKLRKPAS